VNYLIQQIINGLSIGSIYALIAIGYTMVYGILRFINFAHGDLLMLCAYAGLILMTKFFLPTWIALIISVIITSIFAYLIEKLAYKPLRGAGEGTILLSSLFVSILLENLAMLIFSPQAKSFRLPESLTSPMIVKGIIMTKLFFLTFILTIILAIIIFTFLKYHKLGIAMKACSQNMVAANLVGINLSNIISLTFIIGGGLAAIAGFIMAGQYARITPLIGFVIGIKAFVACVIGGIGNIYGAVVGGFILGLSEVLFVGLLAAQYSGYRDGFVFVLLILILLFMPNGIYGSVEGRNRRQQ